MKVPLLDLIAQYRSIQSEIDGAVREVFTSQQFVLGTRVEALEKALADYCQCRHGIGVTSGTDALLLALLCEGIGPGDEVITTAYSFFATAGSIARTGERPIFVDIDPLSFNLRPEQIEARITSRTRAIIPVHLYGQMARMDRIMDIARAHDLVVIEDAAQAIGAEENGQRAGSFGHYGCLSFFPSKNLGGAGDGGMIVTNDEERSQRLRVLRVHGTTGLYEHSLLGGNFRLDALQAAVLLAKLAHLDGWSEARKRHAARYDALFADSGLVHKERIRLPRVVQSRHVFNQYVIRAERRDELQRFLGDQEVASQVYYPIPLPRQKCFPDAVVDCPESDRAALEVLALPIYPELTDLQLRHVVDSISRFYA